MMNAHQRRIVVGGALAVLVATSLLMLVKFTAVAVIGYCFMLAAIFVWFGSFWLLAGTAKSGYITGTAFVSCSQRYAVINILFTLVIGALEQFGLWRMPFGWFLFVQIVLAAIFITILLMLQSGREIIAETGDEVEKKTTQWQALRTTASALCLRANGQSRQHITAVCDAIRYADPVSAPELEPLEVEIGENLIRLRQLVDDGKDDEIAGLCMMLRQQIKERGVRAKLLK